MQGWSYITDYWNISDLVRIILLIVFIVQLVVTQDDDHEFVNALVVLASWNAGVKYLRIFEPFRDFLESIRIIFAGMFGFICVLLFMIFTFTSVFSVLNERDSFIKVGGETGNFWAVLEHVYRIAIGDFDTGNYEYDTWIIFVLASCML